LVRGHVLAGNPLPDVWIPDRQTRDDREVMRARLDAAEKLRILKTQIKCLLKRNGIVRPSGLGEGWTNDYWVWLSHLAKNTGGPDEPLRPGARIALRSLLHQVETFEQEIASLDREVAALAEEHRYTGPVREVTALKGVGLLTGMVYLTEMGDLTRFRNRRQIGAYLGLVPSSNESGEKEDCKGHITHQGPYRVRAILCQATLAAVRSNRTFRTVFDRMARAHPKRKKIFVVAAMRRLAILMWHKGLKAWPTEGGQGTRTEPTDAAVAA
jgi:transposase